MGNLFLSDTSWNHSVHERLEIAGSDGRTLVAENGRRLWMYASRESESIFDLSREPARFWEPPQVVHAITRREWKGRWRPARWSGFEHWT